MTRPGLKGRRSRRGFTLVEMTVTLAVLTVLAAVILPVARLGVKRQREFELRAALRQVRTAIDRYKEACDANLIIKEDVLSECYPAELEVLVEGVELQGSPNKVKFLRRIPVDPMTQSTEWGLRSYQDEADSDSWGGENVWDVYTTSQGVALDGTEYVDW